MSPSTLHPLDPRATRRVRGFTLLELLITIAVIAVLAGLALPSFREFRIRMTVSDATMGLVHALNLARTEAVKRGRPVYVQQVGSWNAGWMVGCDDCTGDPADPDDEQISEFNKDTDYAVTAAGTITRVTFTPAGSLTTGTATAFRICRPAGSANAAENRIVQVLGSGIVSSRRQGGSDPTPAPPACPT